MQYKISLTQSKYYSHNLQFESYRNYLFYSKNNDIEHVGNWFGYETYESWFLFGPDISSDSKCVFHFVCIVCDSFNNLDIWIYRFDCANFIKSKIILSTCLFHAKKQCCKTVVLFLTNYMYNKVHFTLFRIPLSTITFS